jgi:hypothetical protein
MVSGTGILHLDQGLGSFVESADRHGNSQILSYVLIYGFPHQTGTSDGALNARTSREFKAPKIAQPLKIFILTAF